MIAVGLEELFPDPQKIATGLFFERPFGRDTGMDENLTAFNMAELKCPHEMFVPRRQFFAE